MYAGVDLGATNVRAAVADHDGRILGRDRRPTPRDGGVAVTEAVLDAIRTAAAAAGVTTAAIRAVGIGSIGPLDLAAGVVEDPANLPAVERIPLTGPVENLVDGPAYLHNDTTAAVIGERFHADSNPTDMAYLTISSGIGAGVCVDGHWEAYCSGENLPDYAAHLHETEGVETDLPLDGEAFTAADVFAAAGEDPLADRVLTRFDRWNVQGVAALVHAYAPLVVYVGGGVALNNPERVLDPIRERLEDHVMTNVPEIQLTALGDEVGVKGALASAMTGGTGDRARARR